MSEPICVITADCHIDEIIWRDRPSLSGDAYHGFSQCVDLALELNVPLILAGDVVETLPAKTPTSTTIEFLVKQIGRMCERNLPIYNIYGQHDRAVPTWLKACDDRVIDADGRYIPIGNYMFHFLSWRERGSIVRAVQNIRRHTDVLIAHQGWAELMGGSSPEVSARQVPFVSTIVSGDFHRPVSKKSVGSTDNEITLFSPGATHMRKITEPATHYAAVMYDDLKCKPSKLTSRLVFKCEINTFDDLTEAMDTWNDRLGYIQSRNAELNIPEALHKPIYIIRDNMGVGSVYVKMKETIGNAAHLFYSLDAVETAEPVPFATTEFEGEESRMTYFLSKECGEDTQEFHYLKRLLMSDDMRSELKSIRDGIVESR